MPFHAYLEGFQKIKPGGEIMTNSAHSESVRQPVPDKEQHPSHECTSSTSSCDRLTFLSVGQGLTQEPGKMTGACSTGVKRKAHEKHVYVASIGTVNTRHLNLCNIFA